MSLNGVRVALFIEDLYQTLEAWYPYLRLQEAGATVTIIGSGRKDSFTSEENYPMAPDRNIQDVSSANFDAVVVPGGYAPDHMRLAPEMITFVREVFEAGKLTTSVCHGGWILASAGVLKGGRRLTGYPPIKDDVVNAGGTWVEDAALVEDGNVITARAPWDLHLFGKAIVDYLERTVGSHEEAVLSGAGSR